MTGLATAVAGFFGVAEEWGRTVRPPQPSEAPLSPNEWRGYEKKERKLNAGDRSVDSLNNRTEGCASQQRPRRHHGKSADLCADRSVGSDRRRLALVAAAVRRNRLLHRHLDVLLHAQRVRALLDAEAVGQAAKCRPPSGATPRARLRILFRPGNSRGRKPSLAPASAGTDGRHRAHAAGRRAAAWRGVVR